MRYLIIMLGGHGKTQKTSAGEEEKREGGLKNQKKKKEERNHYADHQQAHASVGYPEGRNRRRDPGWEPLIGGKERGGREQERGGGGVVGEKTTLLRDRVGKRYDDESACSTTTDREREGKSGERGETWEGGGGNIKKERDSQNSMASCYSAEPQESIYITSK